MSFICNLPCFLHTLKFDPSAHSCDFISVVPIEVFLRFNKINRLVSSVEEIAKAIKKSDILELSEDCCKVHRNAPLKMKDNEDDCTIYVVCICT